MVTPVGVADQIAPRLQGQPGNCDPQDAELRDQESSQNCQQAEHTSQYNEQAPQQCNGRPAPQVASRKDQGELKGAGQGQERQQYQPRVVPTCLGPMGQGWTQKCDPEAA